MPYEAGMMARFVLHTANGVPLIDGFASYEEHNNQPVVVVRRIATWKGGAYEILAVDGWEGVAYENELQPLPE